MDCTRGLIEAAVKTCPVLGASVTEGLCLHFSAREAKVQLEGRMPANPKARHGSFRDMLWTLL